MRRDLFKVRSKSLFLYKNFLLFLCFMLIIIVLLQAIALVFKDEKTIIVPAHVHQDFWVKENSVSPSYLEEMAVFLADFCLSVSPSSIAYQKSVVLKYTHPSKYGSLKAQFLEMELLFKKQGISTSFRPIKVLVHEKNKAVEIQGDFHTWVGSKHVSVFRKTWCLTFSLERGRLFLLTFQEKEA
jgi:conjugal transfer pilus assembly protein TraE